LIYRIVWGVIMDQNDKHRKGQVALEYLTIYGWVLLAILIVVGYIIYSGYFSTSQYQQAECVIQPGLPCTGYYIESQGVGYVVWINMSNSLGYNITINSHPGTAKDNYGSIGEVSFDRYQLSQGDWTKMKISMSNSTAVKDAFITLYFTFNYTDELGIEHVTSGRIKGRLS